MSKSLGFTLIELVIIIVILGILAVVAIPRYIDLRTQARNAARDGVVASGNAGAQIWRSMYLIDSTAPYDSEFPEAAQCMHCFEDNSVPAVSGITFTYNATAGTWSY